MATARERFEAVIKEGAPLGASAMNETYACLRCKDAGWLRYDVLPGEKHFGEIVRCSCGLVERRSAEYAAAKAGRS